MLTNDPAVAAPQITAALNAANTILVLSHVNPDGDAIGSMLAATHTLRAAGKRVIPLASSALPGYALFLPGIEQVQVYQPGNPLPAADLTLMLDTASLARVGAVYEDHAAALAQRPLLVVDHHVTNDGGEGLFLVSPAAAATCELLYRLFGALDLPVSAEAATCLLLGLTTDTQSFQTSSTKPETLRVAADLLALGADNTQVTQEVYYALPPSSARLIARVVSEVQVEDGIAWATVPLTLMAETGAEDEAADEVVRMMQRIAGVRALVLFKERQDGSTKLSLRSHAPLNVAELARRWGGGGHAQAAGATLQQTPEQAAAEVLPLLRALAAS